MTSTPYTLPPESPFGRMFLPLLAVTVGGLFLLSRHAQSPALLTAGMAILGLGYLPGLAVSLWMDRRFGLWASWILPLILSPVLVTASGLILAWIGMPLHASASWIVLVSVAAVLFAPLPQREIEDWEVSADMPWLIRQRSDRQQVILLASVILALIAIPLLMADWMRETGTAAYHLAVVREVLAGVPPTDPLLAGIPLRDFWAFHVYLAMLTDTARTGGEFLLVGGSLIAAFTMVFSAYRLLTLLALRHTRALWGAIFLFFSLGTGFWFTWIGAGGTGGGGLLRAVVGTLAELPEPADMTVGFPTAAAFFLEPFLAAGPLTIALSYMLLFLMAAIAGLGERRFYWNLLAGFSVLGMVLFHGGLAGLVLLTTVLAVPATWIVAGLNPLRHPGRQLLWLALPVLVAVGLCVPYLQTLFLQGGFQPTKYLDVSWPRSAFLLAMVAPQLALSLVVLIGFLGSPDLRRQAWVVWCVMFLAVCQVIALNGVRPLWLSTLLLHVPFALTAGAAVPGLWSRSPRILRPLLFAVVFVLLVPRTVLGVWAYIDTRDRPVPSPGVARAVAWLDRETPADAVIADTSPEVGLAAHRTLLLAGRDHLMAKGYSGGPVTVRSLAVFSLLRGEHLEQDREASLLFPGGPVYLVRRMEDENRLGPPQDCRLVHEDEHVRLYLWIPSGMNR